MYNLFLFIPKSINNDKMYYVGILGISFHFSLSFLTAALIVIEKYYS